MPRVPSARMPWNERMATRTAGFMVCVSCLAGSKSRVDSVYGPRVGNVVEEQESKEPKERKKSIAAGARGYHKISKKKKKPTEEGIKRKRKAEAEQPRRSRKQVHTLPLPLSNLRDTSPFITAQQDTQRRVWHDVWVGASETGVHAHPGFSRCAVPDSLGLGPDCRLRII